MIILTLWQWWYMHGWAAAARRQLRLCRAILQSFSVSLLLRTLVSPWKQTVNVAGPNTTISTRIWWWVGNQISRIIGFFIRLLTLLAAIFILTAAAALSVTWLLLWPVIPFAVVTLLVMGVMSLWT